MRTHQFGRKIKLPATIVIKHQLRKLMFEDAVKKAEAEARAEATRGLPPENQGANVSCHCYSNHHRRRALGAAPRLS